MSSDRFTEIINYLSAMSRDIGEFRAETKRRLDGLDARMEKLETEVHAGFEKVHADIRHLNQKFEVVAEDLLELRADGRDLRKRVEVLERKQA